MKTKLLSGPSMQKLAIAALVLGIAAWKFGGHSVAMEQTSTLNRPALTVRTTMLQGDQWSRTLSANGSILPWQEAIISAQMQGVRLAAVKVSIGDHVKQGDVLVTLDNFARIGSDPAAAQGRIVAPYDGVISAASANEGSMSQPGVELFRLIRNGRLEWRAELTADELMLLRRGMPVEITVGEGRVLKGAVRAISPSVDAKTRYGYALVSLSDSAGIIAGVYANGTFDISGGKRTLSSLPQSAVMRRGSTAYVLVVDAENRVRERPVKLGQRSGDRIEIRQGLKSDEKVVETGGPFLSEGDFVQVVK
ncbi:MAG: efflux RND transporter periplasmic adaptor subunit [Gammaproteobacteria bacterium]|nr:efflux RND transporter periplasmic adaptor subunit [Gammaproteobacteria bacterium]MBU1775448.1 efflux RND transporter periplasmic adaptor subunit [Gammaproteobacteria bacterium]MBU1969047.1 efflux RND transporter periplasmic adaptor subunit [Gammaproteobacteria bacterium]